LGPSADAREVPDFGMGISIRKNVTQISVVSPPRKQLGEPSLTLLFASPFWGEVRTRQPQIEEHP
jgi:hypothetical protein